MDFIFLFVLLLIIAGLGVLVIKFLKDAKQATKSAKVSRNKAGLLEGENKELVNKNQILKEFADSLRPYSELPNADTYVEEKTREGDQRLEESKRAAEEMIQEAKADAKKIRQKQKEVHEEAERVLSMAHTQSTRTIAEAKEKAEQIAGDAYVALENADSLKATASAMKDLIEGYGDKYLVNTETWVDSLAENWGHKEAGRELKAVRIRIRQMIERKTAAECEYAEVKRKEIALSFVIDAFNGKVDSILAKSKHDNYGTLEKQVRDAFQIVNHHGAAFRDARITTAYLDYRIWELYWVVGAKELEKRSREEQQEIRRVMREEEKARREYEKAHKEAQKEEQMLNKALEQARAEFQDANDEEKAKLQQRLAEIEEKLREAEEKDQRALSMAQQTKQGHVYVISNIGSFGEDTFKIGMTRRLDPLDRVKELGDASVPFSFDVHAIIFCKDAPGVESQLHKLFERRRVNKVNRRKEFFNATVAEIRDGLRDEGIEDVQWTLEAEALEYRETMALAGKAVNGAE